jgi:hypothetical protein
MSQKINTLNQSDGENRRRQGVEDEASFRRRVGPGLARLPHGKACCLPFPKTACVAHLNPFPGENGAGNPGPIATAAVEKNLFSFDVAKKLLPLFAIPAEVT